MFIHRGWDLDVRVYQPCVLRAYYVRTTLLVAVSCLYDADPVPSSTQCQSRLRGEQEATCVQLRNLPAVYRYIGCCSGHSSGFLGVGGMCLSQQVDARGYCKCVLHTAGWWQLDMPAQVSAHRRAT